MEQILRMAKVLKIPKWRTLRIKVTSELKNAEANLEEASTDPTMWDEIPELVAWGASLRAVLVWMDEIEESLGDATDERTQRRARDFDGWVSGRQEEVLDE